MAREASGTELREIDATIEEMRAEGWEIAEDDDATTVTRLRFPFESS